MIARAVTEHCIMANPQVEWRAAEDVNSIAGSRIGLCLTRQDGPG
jgi:hypothetical protein